LAPSLLVAACGSADDRARAALAEAEAQCGLPPGTFKLLGVNDVFDEKARKPTEKKVIAVMSPDLGQRQPCVDGVAQSAGFDRVTRFVYDGTDPG